MWAYQDFDLKNGQHVSKPKLFAKRETMRLKLILERIAIIVKLPLFMSRLNISIVEIV